MPRLPYWCLWLTLTMWMTGSRPPAAIATGIPGSGRWWGSEASKEIRKAGLKCSAAGDFACAGKFFEQGYEEAKRRGDVAASERYLSSIAGCRFAQFRYADALELYLQARKLAAATLDREELGAIAFNLSSLYTQVWDVDSAVRAAEEGRGIAATVAHPYYKAQLLLQLGRLHQRMADGTAAEIFEEAIEAARQQRDVAQEARGWDLLGEERLQNGLLSDAERALDEAFRLRALHYPADLAFSYGRLGALNLAQGDLETAARFTERALTAGARSNSAVPEYLLKHQRGRIRLAGGHMAAALEDFREALDLAASWRLGVLPAVSSLTGANVELEERIFNSFIETGAAEALRSGDGRLAGEAFQAVELNRAASLRDTQTLSNIWRKKLRPEYWKISAELRAEETRLLRAGLRSSSPADRLRLQLTEMEAEVGRGPRAYQPANRPEDFRSQTSLTRWQRGLGDSEVFLSFHLGKAESYLWAVTQKSLGLHRLDPAEGLSAQIREFRDAVQTGRADGDVLGERLYLKLFGALKPEEAGKTSWLLSLEGALFELPFAALVSGRDNGKAIYLIETHSVQVAPGALSLNETAKPGKDGWFLGVADPIYNSADPRWRGAATGPFGRLFGPAKPEAGGGQLARLVASGAELQSSAEAWTTDARTAVVLRGEEARRDKFLELAARGPAVLHLATHVMTPEGRRGEGFIAFGLGSAGGAELLTTSDVALMHVPGALVVMTGCGTGTGEARAGAGLLGLTRAWQMAGASAVIATAWPEKDSKGEMLASFYRHLRDAPAAEALHRSQVEMVRSGTWRTAPAYWATYQVTGGAH